MRKLTAPSAIVVVPILNEAIMEALQITGLTTLGCIAVMSLLYGEIILLQKG
jgi:hypothetical protein